MDKISIRFYDDREVRAVWDDENNQLVSRANQLTASIKKELQAESDFSRRRL